MTPRQTLGKQSTQKIKCTVLFAEGFESLGDRFIVASKGARFETCFFENTELLVSLLRLRERLRSHELTHMRSNGFPELALDGEGIWRVLDWCEKYGMPIYADDKTETWLMQKHMLLGFRTHTFLALLSNLYCGYMLWRRIYNGDLSKDNSWAGYDLEVCKHQLDSVIRTGEEGILSPDFTGDRPQLFIECYSLMSVAHMQLLFACAAAGNLRLGVCELCGAPFSRGIASNVHCPECSRQRYKRSRARKALETPSNCPIPNKNEAG